MKLQRILSKKTRKIDAMYTALKCIYGTKIYSSRWIIPHINHMYTEAIAANYSAMWFVKFVFVYPRMGNRTECQKIY